MRNTWTKFGKFFNADLADKVLYLEGQVIQLYATNKTIVGGNGTSLSLTDTNRYIIDTDSEIYL